MTWRKIPTRIEVAKTAYIAYILTLLTKLPLLTLLLLLTTLLADGHICLRILLYVSSFMVRRSRAGGRVWLSSLWQQKLLVGGTLWGRGRSRNLALRLPDTRDRRRARRSTTSGVVWQFCCSGATLRFWETGFPTSHYHKLMDYISEKKYDLFSRCTVPDTIKCAITWNISIKT